MNELAISLEKKRGCPMYGQIYEYIRDEIQKGKILAGERLPSSRALAAHLGVSRSTVDLAYDQLLAEGYVISQPCRGYFVCEVDQLYQIPISGNQREEKKEPEQKQYLYDFAISGIDREGFPYQTWKKISKSVLAEDDGTLFQMGNSQGQEGLRREIVSYLHHARGVNCKAEQIIVGAGNDYLLLLLHIILGMDWKIAMDNPTYLSAYLDFEKMGYSVVTLEPDGMGMCPDQLEESKATLAYVMPSHHFPLGTVMPIKRRQELLAWAAAKENRFLIEDDYDSEFRYKGKPIPALQGYDIHERVIYLGTFSRSIAPALRMSYMVLPESLLCVYEREYRFINSTVSKIDQKIVERFLAEGYYERHLNRMRALYKSRHDTLLNALKPLLSIGSVSGEYAGVHLLFTFHDGRSEEDAVKKAKQGGIRIYGLSTFETQKMQRSCTILLGFANLPEEEIRAGAALLAEKLLE